MTRLNLTRLYLTRLHLTRLHLTRLHLTRLGLTLLVALLALTSLAGRDLRAQSVIADLAEHLVAIHTGFDGTNILIFGMLPKNSELAIVVRGPARPTVMHRKGSVAGVWVNTATMTFPDAPSFYALASSAPLTEMVAPYERERLRLGLDDLDLQPSGRASPNLLAEWRAGLVRAKQRHGLYITDPSEIIILGGNLFRSTIEMPSNVPIGSYLIDVYLFRDGLNIAAQSLPLAVSKVGVEAQLYALAHQHSALYGILSIVIALLVGWIAHLLFRRR